MSSLAVPEYRAHPRADLAPWPWRPAVLLFIVFAAANWEWTASASWHASDTDAVSAMVHTIEAGQPQRQLGLGLLGLFGLAGVFLPSERPSRLKLLIAYPVLVFVAWAFVSVAWSLDKPMTVKRLVTFGSMLLAALTLVRRYDIREIAQIAFTASLLTALVGVGNEARLIITQPPALGLWRFGGTMHPNHAGVNCAVLMLSSLYLFRHHKHRLFLIVAAIALLLLLGSKSRTALMSGVTATVVYLLLATSLSRAGWTILLSAWGVAALLWLGSMQMLPDASSLINMGREDLKKTDVRQLTGRTDIWKFAIMQSSKDPNRAWLGYGYETFWTPDNVRGVSEFTKFRISEGHSAYLDWYLELGLLGVGVYVVIVLLALVRWTRCAVLLRSPSAAIAAGVIAGAMVHGFAESSSGDANLPALLLFTSIGAACLLRPDEEAVS